MEAPRQKLSTATMLLVIGAAISTIFGLIGKALEPVVTSADFWGTMLGSLIGFARLFSFTTTIWFLLPFAFVTGAWAGTMVDRRLRKRETPQRSNTWITFDQLAKPAPPPQQEDPVEAHLKRYKMMREFNSMLGELNVILGDHNRMDREKMRAITPLRAEVENFYVTMRKSGYQLPPLYEYDLYELMALWGVLRELKPFLESENDKEAQERAARETERLGAVFAARAKTAKGTQQTPKNT